MLVSEFFGILKELYDTRCRFRRYDGYINKAEATMKFSWQHDCLQNRALRQSAPLPVVPFIDGHIEATRKP